MAPLLAVYHNSLAMFGNVAMGTSYAIAGLSFIGYFPLAIVWSVSASSSDASWYLTYFKWVIASNIYSYILTLMNIAWFAVLLTGIFTPIFADLSSSSPDYIYLIIILGLEVILQILFSASYRPSKRLMWCWGYEFPEKGTCEFDDEDLDGLLLMVE